MAAGEAESLAAGENVKVAILDRPGGTPRRHEAWEGNPFIARPGEKYGASIVNAPGYRSYMGSL